MEPQTLEIMKARFLKRVDQTGDCWIWLGPSNNSGYGIYSGLIRGECNAHRIAHILFNGEIPSGMEVKHSCNVRCCVRPEHLSVGTREENIAEKVYIEPRKRLGEEGSNAKLTEREVLAIHRLRAIGLTYVQIGGVFDVHYTNVIRIADGETWPHVWEAFHGTKAIGGERRKAAARSK